MKAYTITPALKIDIEYDENIHDIPSATAEAVEQVVSEALSNAQYNGETNGVRITSIVCPDTENPLLVPNLHPMYEATVNYVKKNQGDKGYVDTQDPDKSMILALVYIDDEFEAHERRVHAVRVNPKDNDLEILIDDDVNGFHKTLDFTEKGIKDKESEWLSVKDENVYFEHTLFKIAENIREHVGV